jgi:hypothetical protein
MMNPSSFNDFFTASATEICCARRCGRDCACP